ncbi:putative RNA-binding Zn ribbon-like protein [Nocardiopsis arvandica]|uniref:Putative RNA-binding Zn ribbon-like protein n=1 Tax=Nocardiopsis sinuspersici TaxID=501010 RepID=A0A7Z0BHN4_9ACTN|nr:CGNR zinc finger domain-containing protein [Nocardiopsis sinuspersici]NYH51181.1 putative RNA-binding Zn ribbon-like protein [Nocardiopsis sinuspersici]
MTSDLSAEDLLRAALALVATRPVGAWPEELDSLDRLEELVPGTAPKARHGAATDLAEVRGLRDRLAPLVLDPDPGSAPAALSALAREFDLAPVVDSVGGPVRHVSPDPRTVARVAEALVPGVMSAWASGLMPRVRTCGADDCDTPFLDRSSRANRHYCSDRCSTRVRVRRHRTRSSPA